MKYGLLVVAVLLVGCSADRKTNFEQFIAECKKAGAAMSVTYTMEGRFGESLSVTCESVKDYK